MAVLMVGGVAVSTAVTDTSLKDDILASCRNAVRDLIATTYTRSASQSAPRPSLAARKRGQS